MKNFITEVLYTQYKNMNSLKQNHVAQCLNVFNIETDTLATLLNAIGYPQDKEIIQPNDPQEAPLKYRPQVYHSFFNEVDYYLEPTVKYSKKARKNDIDNCLKAVCNDLLEYNELNNIKSTKYLKQLLKHYDKLSKNVVINDNEDEFFTGERHYPIKCVS